MSLGRNCMRYVFTLIEIFFCLSFSYNICISQSYNACVGFGNLWHTEIISNSCICNECLCSIEYIANTSHYQRGVSMTPERLFLVFDGNTIYEVDTLTGFNIPYYVIPSTLPVLTGIAVAPNGLIYVMDDKTVGDHVYEINISTGIITDLGPTNIVLENDITYFNGNFYYQTIIDPSTWGIVRLDVTNPENSSLVVTHPASYYIEGISATDICNTLVGTSQSLDQLVYINLLDGTITPFCETPDDFFYLSAMEEFGAPSNCGIVLDLDCNDSSGATDADYNSD